MLSITLAVALTGQISSVQMLKGDTAVVINPTPRTRGWSDPSMVGAADEDSAVNNYFYGEVLSKSTFRGNYYYTIRCEDGTVTIHGGLLRKLDVPLARKIYTTYRREEAKLTRPTKATRKLYLKRITSIKTALAKEYKTTSKVITDVINVGYNSRWP